MKTLIVLSAVCCLVVAVLPQDSSPIVDPGAKFECVFAGGYFLESPAVSPDGLVYFSDITYATPSGMQAGHIWRYDPKSGVTSTFRSPSGMSNGIIFDAKGDMIVAEGADFGGRRVTRTDMRTGKSTIVAGLYKGRPFNSPNDLAVDAKGRIYFTDPRYNGHEPIEQPVMGVYRVDPDSSVHLLAANVWMPNGIALSPDQKTLYVVSCGSYNTNTLETAPIEGGPPSAVHAYDLLEDGTLRYQKQLVTFPNGTWGDGMTVDIDGNIYIAVGGTPKERGVYVYTPAGRPLSFLPTPEDAVNLEFARGADSDLLYVVFSRDYAARGPGTPPMGNGLYRIRLHRRGFHAGSS
jgi:gluconolactonase